MGSATILSCKFIKFLLFIIRWWGSELGARYLSHSCHFQLSKNGVLFENYENYKTIITAYYGWKFSLGTKTNKHMILLVINHCLDICTYIYVHSNLWHSFIHFVRLIKRMTLKPLNSWLFEVHKIKETWLKTRPVFLSHSACGSWSLDGPTYAKP